MKRNILLVVSVLLALLCSCGSPVESSSDHMYDTAVRAAVECFLATEQTDEFIGETADAVINNDGLVTSLNGVDVADNGVLSIGSDASGTSSSVLSDESVVNNESPVSDVMPAPLQNAAADTTVAATCTLSVSCDAIFAKIDDLNPEKAELAPEDGVIFYSETALFYDGESVFNLLQREMKQAKIHMEFVNTPVYDSAYIKGINNLYEFDCGELSGWTYRVNGIFPGYGPSRYRIQPGDVVEFVYSCDLGRDVGNEF